VAIDIILVVVPPCDLLGNPQSHKAIAYAPVLGWLDNSLAGDDLTIYVPVTLSCYCANHAIPFSVRDNTPLANSCFSYFYNQFAKDFVARIEAMVLD